MTEVQILEALCRLYPACVNIIGFHDLSESVDDELHRMKFDAMVYAGGIDLARAVYEIILEVKSSRPSE